MQVTANKTNWLSLIVLAAMAAICVPNAQAAETLRIVHVTPAISVTGSSLNVNPDGFVQVHGRHVRHRHHRRHANRPRFITEEICHRHGGRRHCHTTVQRVFPQQFGPGTRALNRSFRNNWHRRHREHGHRPRQRGFNFILNL